LAIILAAGSFVLGAAPAGAAQSSPDVVSELDRFIKPVVDACVIADLKQHDPASAMRSAGWTLGEFGWENKSRTAIVVLTEVDDGQGCSLYTNEYSAADLNYWFENRIGAAEDIVWDPETPIAAWRLKTNGHGVSVYVVHDINPATGRTSTVLHVIQ